MKIAFVGDSYCDINFELDSTQDSWVILIANKLNAEVILSGVGGDCLLHSYLSYTKVMHEADYTIFCITEPTRLANYCYWPMSHGGIRKYFAMNHLPDEINYSLHHNQKHTPKKKREKIMNAGLQYFEHIYLEEAHEMIHMGTLRSLDEIMIHNKKKCIWFPCFRNSFRQPDAHNEAMGASVLRYRNRYSKDTPWMPKSGPVSNMPLADISLSELPSGLTKDERESWPWPPLIDDYDSVKNPETIGDVRTNHMSTEHNLTLSKIVIDIIQNDSFSPRLIRLQDYFFFGDTT